MPSNIYLVVASGASRTLIRRSVALAAWCALLIAVPASASAAERLISPTGIDTGSCVAHPCRSFDYVYRQADAGDRVEVGAGSYARQTIPSVSGREGPAVEFRAAESRQVSLAGLAIRGSHVAVRDIVTGFLDIDGEPSDSTVEDVSIINAWGNGIWIRRVRDLLIQGGSFGPIADTPLVQIGGTPTSYDVTFDGVEFHDAVATGNGVHMECIWAGGMQGFTVRNSLFRNCAHFDIFFTRNEGPEDVDVSDVLLENNVFEAPKQPDGSDAPYALNVSNWLRAMTNYVIRNNTFGADITIQPTTVVNSRIVGNIGPLRTCERGVTYAYNVWTSVVCSATDRQVPSAMSQFVDPAAHDWRLVSDAAARDAADPADAPSTDRAGLARNGAPDAGAHELAGTLLPPGPAPPLDPNPAPVPDSDPAPVPAPVPPAPDPDPAPAPPPVPPAPDPVPPAPDPDPAPAPPPDPPAPAPDPPAPAPVPPAPAPDPAADPDPTPNPGPDLGHGPAPAPDPEPAAAPDARPAPLQGSLPTPALTPVPGFAAPLWGWPGTELPVPHRQPPKVSVVVRKHTACGAGSRGRRATTCLRIACSRTGRLAATIARVGSPGTPRRAHGRFLYRRVQAGPRALEIDAGQLVPGRYRIVVALTDSRGWTSAARSAAFTAK